MNEPIAERHSERWKVAVAVFAGFAVVRLGIHVWIYKDIAALFEIATLDAVTAVMLVLAWVLVPLAGAAFGSVALTALALGLPMAGMGALAQWLRGAHFSNLVGLAGLLGIGVGWCAAASRHVAFLLLGVVALGLATWWLTSIQEAREALLIAMPAVGTGLVVAIVALRRGRRAR